MNENNIVIVGAGIVGLSTAMHLAQTKIGKVLVLETEKMSLNIRLVITVVLSIPAFTTSQVLPRQKTAQKAGKQCTISARNTASLMIAAAKS